MESSQTKGWCLRSACFPIGKRLIRNYCKLIFWIRNLQEKKAGNWERISCSWGEKLEKEAYGDWLMSWESLTGTIFSRRKEKAMREVWFERALKEPDAG